MYVTELPELTKLLSKESVYDLLAYEEKGDGAGIKIIQLMFHSLMTNDKSVIENNLQALMTRLKKAGE